MPRSAHALSHTIIERLEATEQFAHYRKSFAELTGLPLSLCSLREWPPAARGRDCGNPFCAAVLQKGHECTACAAVQRAIDADAVAEPRSVTCLAGLCETGVPLRAGEMLVGFLVVGPLLLGTRSDLQLNTTFELMKRSGVKPRRAKLTRAYCESPAVGDDRHASVVRMLVVFAEHLSLLTDQVLVQEQHAEPEPVTKAREFIRENLAQPLRVADVARSAGLSRSYFSRMFKRTTTLGFSDYVSRVRIEQAKKLLLNPNMHVNEIAFAVGFQSVPHFNRIFKRLTGEPPGAFRENRLNRASSGRGNSSPPHDRPDAGGPRRLARRRPQQ